MSPNSGCICQNVIILSNFKQVYCNQMLIKLFDSKCQYAQFFVYIRKIDAMVISCYNTHNVGKSQWGLRWLWQSVQLILPVQVIIWLQHSRVLVINSYCTLVKELYHQLCSIAECCAWSNNHFLKKKIFCHIKIQLMFVTTLTVWI
jgi:hypothetical protein